MTRFYSERNAEVDAEVDVEAKSSEEITTGKPSERGSKKTLHQSLAK